MKKLVLLMLVLACFGLTAIAQESPIDKGSMFIGGSVSFASYGGDLYEDDGEGLTQISIAPEFGYFVSPGFYVGSVLLYNSASQGEDDATAFGIGPTLGYYFNTDKARTEVKGFLYPYIRGFFTFQSMSVNDADATATTFGGKGGINYMLSNAVALDMGISFTSESWKPDGADESITGSIIGVGAGVTYFIW